MTGKYKEKKFGKYIEVMPVVQLNSKFGSFISVQVSSMEDLMTVAEARRLAKQILAACDYLDSNKDFARSAIKDLKKKERLRRNES